jgi:hypothetical protein
MITQELLHELFEYREGALYWKSDRARGKIKAGSKAGHLEPRGYTVIELNGIRYKAHRLIFMMFNGYMPYQVDHEDNDPSNNKIENLRAASHGENQNNRPLQKNNTSGVKGVHWRKSIKKWAVQLQVDKKVKYFGSYFDLEVARFVSETMRYKYHGKFANRGEK